MLVGAAGVAMAFVVLVWPTRYRYYETNGEIVREDRLSGDLDALVSARGGWKPGRPAPKVVLERAHGAVASRRGAVVATVEVAATTAQRNTGLQGRARLAEDEGMLFAYGSSYVHTLWMNNCGLHLEFAFLRSDGSIVRIEDLQSGVGLTDVAVPRTTCDVPTSFVLAMNATWFTRHGVVAGDIIDVSAAMEGVRAEE